MILHGTSHTPIRRLTLEIARGVGVVLGEGEENHLAGCVIRGIGSEEIVIEHGKRNGLLGFDIHDLGVGGVRITCG